MSLYGNVKKVGSSTFQFDRVYPNRAEMDLAVKTGVDKVYAGRYVLVEYGQRYTKNETTTINGVVYNNTFSHTVTANNGSEQRIYEDAAFTKNKEADLTEYGAVYDSTVWQKIYTSSSTVVTNEDDTQQEIIEKTMKYIMVAELNATVPQLDMTADSPIKYSTTSNSASYIIVGEKDEDGKLDPNSITKILGVQEEYNKAHFDRVLDTELGYSLHIPKNLELSVNNDNIDYNEKGFDPYFSFGEKSGLSTIAWIPDELRYEGNNLTISPQEVDSKTLYMNFPVIGNTMNTLFNVLYGTPEGDLTNGVLRPYFERFIPTNTQLAVPFTTIDGEELQENGPNGYETQYAGGVLNEIVYARPSDVNVDYRPNDKVIIVYWDGESATVNKNIAEIDELDPTNLYYYDLAKEERDNTPNSKDNIIQVKIFPTKEWFDENVPDLSNVIENNTAGLATVLQSLFGYYDPVTGTTRYYLYSDWTAKQEAASNNPSISNKPSIVGGYSSDFRTVTNTYSSRYIDHYEMDENDNTIPVYGYNENEVIELESKIDYDKWSDGDYYINFDNWQLQKYVAPKVEEESNENIPYYETGDTIGNNTSPFTPGPGETASDLDNRYFGPDNATTSKMTYLDKNWSVVGQYTVSSELVEGNGLLGQPIKIELTIGRGTHGTYYPTSYSIMDQQKTLIEWTPEHENDSTTLRTVYWFQPKYTATEDTTPDQSKTYYILMTNSENYYTEVDNSVLAGGFTSGTTYFERDITEIQNLKWVLYFKDRDNKYKEKIELTFYETE